MTADRADGFREPDLAGFEPLGGGGIIKVKDKDVPEVEGESVAWAFLFRLKDVVGSNGVDPHQPELGPHRNHNSSLFAGKVRLLRNGCDYGKLHLAPVCDPSHPRPSV